MDPDPDRRGSVCFLGRPDLHTDLLVTSTDPVPAMAPSIIKLK